MQFGDFLRGFAADSGQCLANRRRIDAAHQTADILHLPPSRFVMTRHAPGVLDGDAQFPWDLKLAQSFGGQCKQLFAQVLQLGHGVFAPRL